MSNNDFHTDESLSGLDPETTLEVSDEKWENGLDYVSKSRVKTYEQCPYKFFVKYWCEHRGPPTLATERGTIVHELFEDFHLNALDDLSGAARLPESFREWMPDSVNLAQWTEWLAGFYKYEHDRRQRAEKEAESVVQSLPASVAHQPDSEKVARELWKPAEVEAEFWLGDPPQDYDGEPDYVAEGPPVPGAPWMGRLDALLPSQSLPEVEGGGHTVLDYKTGSAPTVKYEGAPFLPEILEGYYREGEFYGMLAEPHYDIDAVAFFFPKDDEIIVSKFGVKKERRFRLKKAALGMQEPPADFDKDGVPENFDFEPQNLCHWGDGMCFAYNVCPSAEGK